MQRARSAVSPDRRVPVDGLKPADGVSGFRWTLAAMVLLFGLVRFACLFNDLWLDEIWSLGLTTKLASARQILSAVNDNNHPLNTFYLYCLGLGRPDWMYRLFSWATGTAAVATAGLIARRQYRAFVPAADSRAAGAAGLLAALLFGASYFLVHYSSEARGYAPAVCFSLVAVYVLWRGGDRAWSPWAVVYWAAAAAALLAHAEAAEIIVAGVVWSIVAAARRWSTWRDRFIHLAAWHAVPAVALIVYYREFLGRLVIGGGPEISVGEATGLASAYTFGLPVAVGFVLGVPLAGAAIVVGLRRLIRNREWAAVGFYLSAILIGFGPVIVRPHAVQLFPRYFLINLTVILLLAAEVVAMIWNRGGLSRQVVGIGLALFLLGSSVHIARLVRYGRGEYRDAVRYLAGRTPTEVISVGSDNDFRNFSVLGYYERELGPNHTFRYYPAGRADAQGPQWIFLHRLDGAPPPDSAHPTPFGAAFQLERVFHHAALSGWDWYLYRNIYLVPEQH